MIGLKSATAFLAMYCLAAAPNEVPDEPRGPVRQPIAAESLKELIEDIEALHSLTDLREALFANIRYHEWKTLPASEAEKVKRDKKLMALKLLLRHGNRVALPAVKHNLAMAPQDQEIVEVCHDILMLLPDIRSTDIRIVLEPIITKEHLLTKRGSPLAFAGYVTVLLEKDYDIRNLPLIVKSIRILGTDWPNYKCSLRNVIFGRYREEGWIQTKPRSKKSRFFPYEFDDFVDMDMDDVENVLKIYEKNKERIPVREPLPGDGPVT